MIIKRSSHLVVKRQAPDLSTPKIPIKLPEVPKVEKPQIKMRRKRQDANSNPFGSIIPSGIITDFKAFANSTQTQLSKIPGIGSFFST